MKFTPSLSKVITRRFAGPAVKLIFCTVMMLAALLPRAMAYPFTGPTTIQTSFGKVVGVADFNRDGQEEVLTASTHNLVWMRYTTGTSFTQVATLSWPAASLGRVVTRDMDGDGDTDVVLNTLSPSQLVVLRNDANFVFTKVLEVAVPDAALQAGAIVGDYDSDGDLDAGLFHTVTGESVRRIAWAANNAGVFTLQPPMTQNVTATYWLEALTEDFDQDGFMDLTMGATNVASLGGTPSGIFQSWPDITFTGSITHMESGDIDRDGYPDLVLTSGTAGLAQRSSWCRWNGAGFDAPSSIQNHTTGRVRGTHLVDVDEDGDLDAVFGDQAFYVDNSNQGSHQILWAENSGGSFLVPKVLLAGNEAAEIYSGDVDGDGDPDLVYSAIGSIFWLRNTAIHRSAEFSSQQVIHASAPIGDICPGDMDNDGEGDLVWSIPSLNTVKWESGHRYTDVGPALGNSQVISTSIAGASVLAVGDLTHDGRDDVVTAAEGIGQLQLVSRAASTWVVTNVAPLPPGTTELMVADVDQDGHNDIIIGHATGITLLRRGGAYTPSWTTEIVVSNIGPVTKICPVQINGSGRLELMAMTTETSPVRSRIYRYAWSSAFGFWLNPTPLWEGDSASGLLATGDANRDQASDVFYAVTGTVNCAPSTITSLTLGTPKPILGLPAGLRCAEAADFNNDGVLDLVAAGGGVAVLVLGKGDGTFGAANVIFSASGAALNRMVVYDVEHDGDMDILLLDTAGNEVQLVYNNCGQFDLMELGMGDVIPVTPSAAPVAMLLSFTHAGRTGDASAAIRSLRFRLLSAVNYGNSLNPGAGLTTAQASALISAVEIYNDLGEPMNFESGIDPLVGSVGSVTSTGYLTVTPATGINFAPGQTVRLWVRIRMTANADASALRGCFIQHVTDPTTAGTLVAHTGVPTLDFRLDPMLTDEALVRLVVTGTLENWRFTNWGQYDGTGTAANYADSDGDGVYNLLEYFLGTNPTVAEPSLNAAARLTVLPMPTAQSPVNVRVTASNAALANPRVRMRIEDGSQMPIWNNFASETGGVWTRGNPTIQVVGGRTFLTFATGHTPQTMPRFFVRMLVEEVP